MSRLKVAVLGLGKMGFLHSSILATIPSVELVALCDKSLFLQRFAKRLFKNTLVVNDVAKLSNLGIDCAFVTAPIPAHYPIVKALYSEEITRHIFVEKTLASTWRKANELCALTMKTPGVNMVGYMKRFSTTFSKAKCLLNESVLGELISFEAFAFSSDFARISHGSKSIVRGGVLSDLGSHIIDIALWFFGDFEVEKASIKSVVNEDSEDSANFLVRKSGLIGAFDISWCKENYRMPNFGLVVRGDNGMLTVNDYTVVLDSGDGKRSSWYRHQLHDAVPFLLGEPEYYREDNHFIKSVLNNVGGEPNFKTASKVDYIIDKVKKEAQEIV